MAPRGIWKKHERSTEVLNHIANQNHLGSLEKKKKTDVRISEVQPGNLILKFPQKLSHMQDNKAKWFSVGGSEIYLHVKSPEWSKLPVPSLAPRPIQSECPRVDSALKVFSKTPQGNPRCSQIWEPLNWRNSEVIRGQARSDQRMFLQEMGIKPWLWEQAEKKGIWGWRTAYKYLAQAKDSCWEIRPGA